MTGAERRQKILMQIQRSSTPVSSTTLKNTLGVSRQTITQDIARLRSEGYPILATSHGYIALESQDVSRLFKVYHDESRTEEELNLIVDLGGSVLDVIVNHKAYGKISLPMNIKNRRDIQIYLNHLKQGKSKPLLNLTSGYHFHLISAEQEEILDEIEEALYQHNFLAKVLPYEEELF